MSTSYTCRESSVQKHGAAGGSSFPLQWNAIFRCCWHTVRQIPLTTLLRDIESRECRDSYQPPPSLFSFVKAQVHYCTFTWQFAWISQFPLAWNSWQHWATAIQKTIVQWQMTSTSTLSSSELEKTLSDENWNIELWHYGTRVDDVGNVLDVYSCPVY